MSVLYFSISSEDSRSLKLELRATDAGANIDISETIEELDHELLHDLIVQLVETDMVEHPARILSRELGRLMFAGRIGETLRAFLSRGELSCLFLTLDGQCRDWPWELATDPQTALTPALVTAMVRRHGRMAEGVRPRAQGLLVMPKNIGRARHRAVLAASKQLGRCHGLDIYAVDPATGPGVRQNAEPGAAMVHIESAEDGIAILDDGPVPLHRLGLGENTWLTTLSGGCQSTETAYALRDGGSSVVLCFRFKVPAHHSSSFFRALWKALADGDSVASATLQARYALYQLEGADGRSWASPILIAAGNRQAEPAMAAFPPSQCIRQDFTSPSFDGAPVRPRRGARRSVAWGRPMPAPVFVQNTVRRMMTGLADEVEREKRASAMRQLGGNALDRQTNDGRQGLSPAERIRMLSDKLVDAAGHIDAPLRVFERSKQDLTRLSEACLLSPACIQRLLALVHGHRIVYIHDETGRDGIDVARRIAGQGFNFFPITYFGDDGGAMFEPPDFDAEDGFLRAGALYRAVSGNWRRDEIDPYQPAVSGPVTRMPTVARDDTGWQIYSGSWLVIDGAHRLAPENIHRLMSQLDTGQLMGLGHRGPYSMPVPSDFRVLLVGRWANPTSALGIPIIELEALDAVEPFADVWLEEVNHLVGEPLDARAATSRRALANRLYDLLMKLHIIHPVSVRTGASILAHTVVAGGTNDAALIDATCTALAAEFDALDHESQAAIQSIIRGDDKELSQRLHICIEQGGVSTARRVALFLDRSTQAGSAHRDALAKTVYAGNGPLAWYMTVSSAFK